MRWRNTLASIVAALLLVLPVRAAYSYSNMYVFGDSLSDPGNVYAATTAFGGLLGIPITPGAPYFAGRFSNGLNFADWLSIGLFNQATTPFVLGGTNYAVGGATTGLTNNAVPDLPIATGMVAQYGYYSDALNGAPADSQALYLVYGGSNDMLGLFESLAGTDPGTWGPIRDQAVATATGNIEGIIAGLAGQGARHFLVPNLADLGLTPRYLNSAQSSFASQTVQQFNATLAGALGFLDGFGLDIHRLDIYGLLNGAIANPGAFGLTNVTDACYNGPLAGGPPDPCTDADQHLFWDTIHPSAKTHQLLGYFAYVAVIPEPGTYALMGVGLVVLAGLARRQRV